MPQEDCQEDPDIDACEDCDDEDCNGTCHREPIPWDDLD